MCSPKLLLVMSLFAFFFFTVAHFHLAGRQHFSFSHRQFPCFNSSSFVLYLTLYLFPCYRKIPKISPGAYIFQRPFLRGLYSEGLIYGGKFACQNRLGQLEVNLPFLLCFTLYLRAISQVQAPLGLIFGGAIKRRVFCVTGVGGLYMEGLIFGILRYPRQ